VAGENVQDKLGTIHDTDGQCAFKIPKLRGGKVVIEKDQSGSCRLRNSGDLFHLALANQRGRIRSGPSLDHFRDYFRPCTGYQLTKFCEGCWAVRRMMLRRVGIAHSAGKLGCFACKCSGAR
jgi:hypothetical protein